MNRLALFVITFLIAGSCFGQHLFYGFPRNINKRLRELKHIDTLVMYYRGCSACKINTPLMFYILHKERKKVVIEVYRWTNPNIDVPSTRVYRKSEKNGNIRDLLNFTITHLDKIKTQSVNETPFFESRETVDSNGVHRVELKGNDGNHGPFISYYIDFGKNSFSGTILGVTDVAELFEKLPDVGHMAMYFHELYSIYSKERIVDRP